MPQGVVIIGVQWGDEGKGKIVDYYAAEADVVARFQGGNNAGHTLVVQGKQTILHLIPSGILHPHAECVIGSGVVVDPEVFLQEVDVLRKAGVPDLERRLALSDRAHVILDYHRKLDAAREGFARDGKIGTTKRGIGPAYEDRAARRGIRIADLYNEKIFAERLAQNFAEKNFLLKEYYKAEPLSMDQVVEKYRAIAEKLRPFVRDTASWLNDAILRGRKVLFEGAQGVLLDVDYGSYPYVTSSHTLPSQAALGLGVRLPKDTLFLGTIKAYSTRVGEGPFPTELENDAEGFGERLRQTGKEYGATTGRPRRCGWLDLVAVRYALRTCGIRHLAITKADVLTGLGELKVCVGYQLRGQRIDDWPADSSRLDDVEPIYETLPGWHASLDGLRSAADLPLELKQYLRFIEDFTGTRVNLVSTGAGREAVIDIHRAF
jgi:adenylosuccinate synthase